jgi:hypothetical protein
MRYFPALFAVVVIAGLVACGGKSVTLPAVSPDEVEVFMPGLRPSEECETMARLEREGPLDMPDGELIDMIRSAAAEVGADAVVVEGIRRTTEGQAALDLNLEQKKYITGNACYYPSQHPELVGN